MNLLQYCFKRMKNALTRGLWKKKSAKHGLHAWLASFVGRRVLHRYILQTGQQQVLDTIPLNAKVRSYFLSELEAASKQIPSGTIVIEGDMAQMRTSDWLTVEANAIKQLLLNSPKVHVNVANLLDQLPTRSDSLAFIRSFIPFWANVAGVILGTGSLVSFIASLFLMTNAAERVTGGAVFAASLIVGLLVMLYLRMVTQATHGTLVVQAADELSSTWDGVFAMRTDMDAVLLGMLFGVINEGRVSDPDRAIPDFLAMTPAQAYLIASKVVASTGHFEANMSDILFEAVEQLVVEAPSGTIDGFDFSAFQHEVVHMEQEAIGNPIRY